MRTKISKCQQAVTLKLGPNVCSMSSNAQCANFALLFELFLESGYPVNAKHAELERRSVYQLRLKAVEMLRSRTRLVKSHGDDLGLEYLWNRDEYRSLENSSKAMEKNGKHAGQSAILDLVHVMERPITVHYEDSDKGTVFGEFFTDRPGIDIFIIQKNVTTNEN